VKLSTRGTKPTKKDEVQVLTTPKYLNKLILYKHTIHRFQNPLIKSTWGTHFAKNHCQERLLMLSTISDTTACLLDLDTRMHPS
jgi:hypothetical protein